jgi:hypothetical protein
MSDMPSYDRNKAGTRQKETPLNTSGKGGVVPCSPSQSPGVKVTWILVAARKANWALLD